MTSRRFPANLKLDIRPSRLLCAWLLLSHGAVLMCLLVSPLPTLLQLLSVIVLIASALYHVTALFRLSGPYSAQGLAYRAGQWYLQTSAGEQAASLQSSWVLPLAVGMHLNAEVPVRLLILTDSCGRDDFRRLRQILRFARLVPGIENGVERLR